MNVSKTLFSIVLMNTLGGLVNAASGDLYGITGAGFTDSLLYVIDPKTGTSQLVGDTGLTHVTGIDFDPTTGELFGILLLGERLDPASAVQSVLIRIDPDTGSVETIGVTGVGRIPDMAIDDQGNIRAWAEFGPSFEDRPVLIDRQTGAATVTGPFSIDTERTGLAILDAQNLYVKVTPDGSSGVSDLHVINATTGNAALAGQFENLTLRNLLENEPGGTLLSGNRTSTGTQLYRLDPNDTTVTTLGFTGVQLSAVAYRPEGESTNKLTAEVLGWFLGRSEPEEQSE